MSDDENKGDLAILETTVWLILKKYQDATINLINVDYSEQEILTKKRFKYISSLPVNHLGSFFPGTCYRKKGLLFAVTYGIVNSILSFWSLLVVFLLRDDASILLPKRVKNSFHAIKSADLIILKGGSYIYSFGRIRDLIFLYRILLSFFISIMLNKKIIVLGHSIGPAVGQLSKLLIRYCLNKSIKIVTREELSYKFVVEKLKIDKDKIELLPDMAFWHKKDDMDISKKSKKEIEHILDSEGITSYELSRLNIGVTVRDWHFPLQKENSKKLFYNYLDSLTRVLNRLANDYQANIFIIPHVLSDLPTGEKIVQRISKACRLYLLKGDYSTSILRRLYGAMDFLIATRIHSAIFAFSVDTPVVAIAYEIPKGFGIVGMIEGSNYVIDIAKINEDILWNVVNSICIQKEKMRKMISDKIESINKEIEINFDRLIQYSLNYNL